MFTFKIKNIKKKSFLYSFSTFNISTILGMNNDIKLSPNSAFKIKSPVNINNNNLNNNNIINNNLNIIGLTENNINNNNLNYNNISNICTNDNNLINIDLNNNNLNNINKLIVPNNDFKEKSEKGKKFLGRKRKNEQNIEKNNENNIINEKAHDKFSTDNLLRKACVLSTKFLYIYLNKHLILSKEYIKYIKDEDIINITNILENSIMSKYIELENYKLVKYKNFFSYFKSTGKATFYEIYSLMNSHLIYYISTNCKNWWQTDYNNNEIIEKCIKSEEEYKEICNIFKMKGYEFYNFFKTSDFYKKELKKIEKEDSKYYKEFKYVVDNFYQILNKMQKKAEKEEKECFLNKNFNEDIEKYIKKNGLELFIIPKKTKKKIIIDSNNDIEQNIVNNINNNDNNNNIININNNNIEPNIVNNINNNDNNNNIININNNNNEPNIVIEI